MQWPFRIPKKLQFCFCVRLSFISATCGATGAHVCLWDDLLEKLNDLDPWTSSSGCDLMPGVRGENVKANVQCVWLKTNRSCLTCMLILLFSGEMPRVSLLVFNPSTQMTRKNHRSYGRIIRSLGSSTFASSHIERRIVLMLE